MFREVRKDETFPQMEERTLNCWDADDAFANSLRQSQDKPAYTFYDGPPFATGLPHYGHLLAGTIKDIVPRYWTMRGRHVPRRFGWDCHGLPVESLVQNELGLAGVAGIKEFGEGKFNEACRGSVLKYVNEWRRTVRRMGRWVDFDRDYKTMDPSFMESVWWVFKQCWDKGLIYSGYRVQPYSPALATPLSNFETNQGYQDRQDPSVTLTFPLVEGPGGAQLPGRFAKTSLLVWTTTPWTLPANLALAVGAEIAYVLIEIPEGSHAGQKVWLAESRLAAYFSGGKGKTSPVVIDRCIGEDLKGLHYEPLFRFADALATPAQMALRYQIYCADFVSTADGAGAVHIAPSFGEEDFQLGKQIGLGLFDPLDVEGKFTSLVGQWQQMGAKDADKSILAALKERNRVLRHETIVHSYPHCYRTGVPLLYRALQTWFLSLEKEITGANGEKRTLKDWMLHCNSQINWVPDHIKNGRFGKWLENARDWNISRNRFWGTPLPVWIADDGEMLCVGSVQELEQLSGVLVKDLHKHFVDTVVIRTIDGKTFNARGKEYRRTPEVFDCWFESGSMPYAQNHYPFENPSEWEKGFPAEFIAEGLDQTRGWFYTLTVLSAALFQKPAFTNVIVNGIILAEDGTKMSKSKKNYPDPNELIGRTGADAIRLFMINSAALKAEDLRFSEEGVKQIVKSVMLPLWNALGFFVANHNADATKGQLSWLPGQPWQGGSELDRWIIALLQELAAKVEEEMAAYRLYNVVPALVQFVDDLTNWYVRRSRRRFWKSENDGDKNAAYSTLYKVLVDFSRLLAPFLPFLSEEIHQILVREPLGTSLSVHHCDFPLPQASLRDEDLVQRMALVRGVVEKGRILRAAGEVKNRQPLGTLTLIPHGSREKQAAQAMSDLILEELNVRELRFLEDETALVSLSAKPNFMHIKTLGPEYARNMKEIAARLATLDTAAVRALQENGELEFSFGKLDSKGIVIQRIVPEGLAVEADQEYTVALDLQITPQLRRGCMARELVNRLQNRRKEMDFAIADRIVVKLSTASSFLNQAIEENREYIMGEVQADILEVVNELPGGIATDADGQSLQFTLSRV